MLKLVSELFAVADDATEENGSVVVDTVTVVEAVEEGLGVLDIAAVKVGEAECVETAVKDCELVFVTVAFEDTEEVGLVDTVAVTDWVPETVNVVAAESVGKEDVELDDV